MKKLLIVFSVLFNLLFSSCIQEIDLMELKSLEAPYVSGMISPEGSPSISMGISYGILDTLPGLIDEAHIELWRDDDLVIKETGFNLSKINIPPGIIRAGSVYKLELTQADGKSIIAIDSVPYRVSISSAEAFIGITYDQYGDPHTDYTIRFFDPATTENFYELLFVSQLLQKDKTYISYKFLTEIADPVIEAEGLVDLNPSSFVFSDQLFNGKVCNISMKMIAAAKSTCSSEPLIKDGDGTYVILRSVSKSYYTFRKSWIKHRRTQNRGDFKEYPLDVIFMGNPVDLYTNIQNAYGIFAAYNQAYKKIEIKKWQEPKSY